MNDEQIRDSMTHLAARGPQTDIWPLIRSQVIAHKPRRQPWPRFTLRAALVSLDAVAIAVLLFITFGLGRSANTAAVAGQSAFLSAATPSQSATANQSQCYNAVERGSERLYLEWSGNAPASACPVTNTFTLTDFARFMGADPTFLLPLASSSGYHISGVITTDINTYEIIGNDGEPAQAYEPSRSQWSVDYSNATNAVPRNITIMAAANQGYTLGKIRSNSDSFNIIDSLSTSQKPSAEYHRPDRLIQIFHDQSSDSQPPFARVYFLDPQNKQKVLTTYTLTGSSNVPDDDLLKMADSIERVDPNHLERYR